MRTLLDVLRFELRLHLRSPLFWGVALLFFALHFLTLTRTGINLGDNERIAINSAWLIFQTELVLGVFGMLPAMVFIVTAMTRDTEYRTAELFFTTPVPRAAFLLGRFSGGSWPRSQSVASECWVHSWDRSCHGWIPLASRRSIGNRGAQAWCCSCYRTSLCSVRCFSASPR